MNKNYRRRQFVEFTAACSAMVFTGCTTNSSSTPTESTASSATPAPEQSPSATPSSTPEPVRTASNPADLIIINQTETPQSVTVTVETQDGASIYADELDLNSGSRTRLDILSQEATGVVRITVRLSNGTEAMYDWDLSEEPADGWVAAYIESDESIRMTYAIA